ncbi:hypothetical protein AYI68_g5280 [Smittium mucronatum]|uniref:Uncharacterized protein n=1 Tax=Smittium mucronatum TaxID=133383 RepID=A0A1R0GUQ6_9FUNG|nr:hypothetical protein AYI68_g5280 [Smittium mucronatum]
MKKRKIRIEKTIIPTTISSSAGLPAAYLPGKGSIYQSKDPPWHCFNAEIRLTVERWTCALDYVSAMLNDMFLLFLDGPPLESLSSESLCAISTTPNQE